MASRTEVKTDLSQECIQNRDTQQSSDMVERVARAIYARGARADNWDKRNDAFKVSWRRDARAALEASHHAELVGALERSRRVSGAPSIARPISVVPPLRASIRIAGDGK